MTRTIYDFPRWAGNPWQYWMSSRAEFDEFVRDNDGKQPCFTSHNAWTDEDDTATLVRYVPFDFDAKGEMKLENTLADVLFLRQWCRERSLPYLVNFTGGRGFHFYIVCKPATYRYNQGLRRFYYAVQATAALEARLRSVDRAVIGDPRRILRIVNCRHDKTGLYTVQCPEWLLDYADIARILSYAKQPQPLVPHPEGKETLVEMVRRLGLKPPRLEDPAAAPVIPYKAPATADFSRYVQMVLPRMCIHSGLLTNNPPHIIRYEACRSLVWAGWDFRWLLDFFRDVAEYAKWVDRANRGVMNYHISHLFRRHYEHETSCTRIRSEGYCVGAVCPRFAREFPAEAVAHPPGEPQATRRRDP